MVLLFISLLGDIIVNLLLSKDIFISLVYICFIFPWFIISFGLKLEKNFFYEYLRPLILSATLISISCTVGGIFLIKNKNLIWHMLNLMTIFLLITAWQFSLTIEKKFKIIFLLGGVGYLCLKIIQIFTFKINVFFILLIILVIIAISLILIAEWSMIKKDYLKYI